MSSARPIYRDNRRRDINAAVGQLVFQFDAALFDAADLAVSVSTNGQPFELAANVQVIPYAQYAGASVVFATAPRDSAGSVVVVRLEGRRVHERRMDVTRGARLSSAALEDELDRTALVLQEIRRDLDAAVWDGVTAFKADAFGPYAARAAYDSADRGFIFLQTDDVRNRPVFFIKQSAALGDWSDWLIMAGPAGDEFLVTPEKLSPGGPTWIPEGDLTVTRDVISGNGLRVVKDGNAGIILRTNDASLSERRSGFVDTENEYGVPVACLALNVEVDGSSYINFAVQSPGNRTADRRVWNKGVNHVGFFGDGSQLTGLHASNAEAQVGTVSNRSITPAGLRAGLNAVGAAPIYAVRAWGNFNGIGTPAIRGAGNISSITDLGQGAFRPNFIVAMPNTTYAATVTCNYMGSPVSANGYIDSLLVDGFRIITAFRVNSEYYNDPEVVSFIVVG